MLSQHSACGVVDLPLFLLRFCHGYTYAPHVVERFKKESRKLFWCYMKQHLKLSRNVLLQRVAVSTT